MSNYDTEGKKNQEDVLATSPCLLISTFLLGYIGANLKSNQSSPKVMNLAGMSLESCRRRKSPHLLPENFRLLFCNFLLFDEEIPLYSSLTFNFFSAT